MQAHKRANTQSRCSSRDTYGMVHGLCRKQASSARRGCRSDEWANLSRVPHIQRRDLTIPKTAMVEPVVATDSASDVDKQPYLWTKAWYPVGVVDALDEKRPHAITLLGEDYVLWRDVKGEWKVFADRCPHRLAPLSEGLIAPDGTLLCAYHAWRFDGSGKCTAIPQSASKEAEEKACANPRSCATSYPTKVAQGLIWMWPEAGPLAEVEASMTPPNTMPELENGVPSDFKAMNWRAHDLAYGLDYFVENVTDPAHVVVSHHGIVGNRYTDAKYVNMETIKPVHKTEGIVTKILGENGLVSHTTWLPPNLVRIESEWPDGAKLWLMLYVVPNMPGRCINIGRQVFRKGKSGTWPPGLGFFANDSIPEWFLHVTAPAFLHQDLLFLHKQQSIAARGEFRDRPAADKYYCPISSDQMVLLGRKWFELYAPAGIPFGGEFEGKPMPPMERDDNKLFDTWNTHTKNCKVCLQAHDNLKKARIAAWAVAAVAAIQVAVVMSAAAAAKAAALAVSAGASAAVAGATGFGLPPLAAFGWGALVLIAAGAAVAIDKIISLFHTFPFKHADNP